MKLSARDAAGFIARPDKARAGVLLYGADAMRVALKRQELIANLVGPNGEEEMRLSRIPAADLRKDKALASDALRAQGFFPGPRAVLIEEAADGLTAVLAPLLDEWREGDATLVVTAAGLAARSSLRKAFEGHRNAVSIGVYDDPPGRAEIEAELTKAGLGTVPPAAMEALASLARALDPGDFRQTVEKIGLYKYGDESPLAPADIEACAPASTAADLDALLHAVAEGRPAEIGPLIARLSAQGTEPVGLCIAATRHFRALHRAAADPEGPAKGIARMRPPVHFRARDRMVRQAGSWGVSRLESALEALVDTDLTLRSPADVPRLALIERTLIRLAYMPRG